MDDLAEQIVEHFPKEDKVFSKHNEVLKEHTFVKDLFSILHRNLGVIVMVPEHAVAFVPVFITHVKNCASKPRTHLPQHL